LKNINHKIYGCAFSNIDIVNEKHLGSKVFLNINVICAVLWELLVRKKKREELENEIQRNISEFDVSQVCQMLRLRRKRCGVYHLFYSRLVEFLKANLDQLSFQKSLRRIGYLSFATSI
jgi:hypothetical protein